MNNALSNTRRSFISAALTGIATLYLSPLMAESTVAQAYSSFTLVKPRRRYALLIGNQHYSGKNDILPAHKNVDDLKRALECIEFSGEHGEVRAFKDLGPEEMRREITRFGTDVRSRAGNEDAVFLFYFCGHGAEIEGTNYLIPAGVDQFDTKASGSSVKLEEVLAALPRDNNRFSVALIDACRTDPTFSHQLIQTPPPENTVLFFATQAGRPALAPHNIERNTYFAQAIVEKLDAINDKTPLDTLFQNARDRCEEICRLEFEKKGLTLQPQLPELRYGIVGSRTLFPVVAMCSTAKVQGAGPGKAASPSTLAEDLKEEDKQALDETLSPKSLGKRCHALLEKYPNTGYVELLKNLIQNAKGISDLFRDNGWSADSFTESAGDPIFRQAQRQALQKRDRDAAFVVALAYREGKNGAARNESQWERWMMLSALLDNGKAAYDLAEHYKLVDEAKYGVEIAKLNAIQARVNYWPPQKKLSVQRGS